MEFEAKADFAITKLGRAVNVGASALEEGTTVTLWDSDGQALASVQVGPGSHVSGGYAYGSLASSVPISKGSSYRVSSANTYYGANKYPTSYARRRTVAAVAHQTGLAAFKGQVTSSAAGQYPSSGPSSNRAAGAVNFGVLTNGGCGDFPWECGQNNTCVERNLTGFAVLSGPCSLVDGDSCVTSANYPDLYGNQETCTIHVQPGMQIDIVDFSTEYWYDKLYINGNELMGSLSSLSATQNIAVSEDITWSSDYSVTRSGWKLCISGAGALLEDATKTVLVSSPVGAGPAKPPEPESPDLTLIGLESIPEGYTQ